MQTDELRRAMEVGELLAMSEDEVMQDAGLLLIHIAGMCRRALAESLYYQKLMLSTHRRIQPLEIPDE